MTTRSCSVPPILWFIPFLRGSKVLEAIHDVKQREMNGRKISMFSSMALCDDSTSIMVCTTNWPSASQQRVEEQQKTQYTVPFDYDSFRKEAQRLVETCFHLFLPTYIIFDMRSNEQDTLAGEDNNGMRMFLYMTSIIQTWRTLHRHSLFSIIVGTSYYSFLLSKWSMMMGVVQQVENEELPNFLESMHRTIFLWKGAIFVRSSTIPLGSGIVRMTRDEHRSKETRSLCLFFRQLESVSTVEPVNVDPYWWHTIILPCEFQIQDQENEPFHSWCEKKSLSCTFQWFRITFRTQTGGSRSCLLYRPTQTSNFEMHTIIPLTYPGYFSSLLTVITKQLYAMASSMVSKENGSDTDSRTLFATLWKSHIQKMYSIAYIKPFWNHSSSLEQPPPPSAVNQNQSNYSETGAKMTEALYEVPIESPRKSCAEPKRQDEYFLSTPNKTGMVKRRKKALNRLSVRNYPREELFIRQDEDLPQISQTHSDSTQELCQQSSSPECMPKHSDIHFVPLYEKVIDYWFSLLGQHFQIDDSQSDLLEYPALSNVCDEIYQSLAKSYHQVANNIFKKGPSGLDNFSRV